jgi:hypothetical protein
MFSIHPGQVNGFIGWLCARLVFFGLGSQSPHLPLFVGGELPNQVQTLFVPMQRFRVRTTDIHEKVARDSFRSSSLEIRKTGNAEEI